MRSLSSRAGNWSARTLALAGLILATTTFAAAGVQAGIKEGGPGRLQDTRSLGRVIAEAGAHPVHIIFVHGIRAEGPGTSAAFRNGLCTYVRDACPRGKIQPTLERSERLDIGPRPPAKFVGADVWTSDAEWDASRPFVDRYVYRRGGAAPIVVDEINWWPLLFPLKCRELLRPEVNLSGRDRHHLKLCGATTQPYYPWFDQAELTALLAQSPKSGGGALANSGLKQQLLNWGLSDAVIALGPMRAYLRAAMNEAFAYASVFDGKAVDDQEFVVVSESLGSFVVMDAFQSADSRPGGVRDVVAGSSNLYFLANQFALLQLGRIAGIPQPPGPPGLPPPPGSQPTPLNALESWARTPARIPARSDALAAPGAPPPLKQIIAFSDPSDALTFDVPAIVDPTTHRPLATVVNLYDRNELSFFGLFVDPIAAHTGHSRNSSVLKTMFRP